MGARWALPLLACLLSSWGASAGRLQVGQAAKAHQAAKAAKARFGGKVAGLARALRSGLAADRQAPPELMARLARERLGLEADGLEPAGAALLRSFVGGAPDSVLLSPMGMAGGDEVDAPGDQGFAVVEEGPGAMPDGRGVVVVQSEEEAPGVELGVPNFMRGSVEGFPGAAAGVVEGLGAMPDGRGVVVVQSEEEAPGVELGVPNFMRRGGEGAPSARGLLRQDAVAHAARRLASEMQDIQDTLGREVLHQIVGEFFSDAARRAEQDGAMAAIEAWRRRQALERSFGHLQPRGGIAEHTADAGGSDRHVRLYPEIRSGGTPPPPNATKPAAARNKTAAPAATTRQNKTAGSAAMVERAVQVSRPPRTAPARTAAVAKAPHHAVAKAPAHTAAVAKVPHHEAAAGAAAWPQGSKNATWHDQRGVTFRRTCEHGRCVTRVMRRRAR